MSLKNQTRTGRKIIKEPRRKTPGLREKREEGFSYQAKTWSAVLTRNNVQAILENYKSSACRSVFFREFHEFSTIFYGNSFMRPGISLMPHAARRKGSGWEAGHNRPRSKAKKSISTFSKSLGCILLPLAREARKSSTAEAIFPSSWLNPAAPDAPRAQSPTGPTLSKGWIAENGP